MIIAFSLNGESVEVNTVPHRRAVDLLREDFQQRSLRQHCIDASCGSCLILMDDCPALSCILPAFELRSRDIWTMEGLSQAKSYADITTGFQSAQLQLCAACAPARALATEALLRKTQRPSVEQARESAGSVLCGCSPTSRILDGILRSARLRKERRHESQ